MKSNMPVDRNSSRHPKPQRSFWFNPIFYKKRSAIERFITRIEVLRI